MKRICFNRDNYEVELNKLFNRPSYPPEIEVAVRDIINDVRKNGDQALVKYAGMFDHAHLTPERFRRRSAKPPPSWTARPSAR
ncbi:MAG: hypothetical protein RR060_04770 [Victivallaceae bacterium]